MSHVLKVGVISNHDRCKDLEEGTMHLMIYCCSCESTTYMSSVRIMNCSVPGLEFLRL